MCDKKADLSRPSLNRKLMSPVTTGVALLGLLIGADRMNAAVPNPIVSGPIPTLAAPGDPSHNYPFFSTTVDLAKVGYVEEEFFFEGTANRYNMPPLETGSVLDSGHPYRTRMIARRPALPSAFNGTVVVEWLNVANGYDADATWLVLNDHYIRRGYAWIGVSAQLVGVDALKSWSPSRYGTLDVTQGGTILNDALSFDIFSQAAQAVRSPAGIPPLGALHAETVFAIGNSQSAIRGIAPYYNSIHSLANVFDAFLLVGGGGLLRTDLNAKAFKLRSETDIAVGGNQVGISQPDSDHFRTWEVAGTAHFDHWVQQARFSLQIRDGVPAIPAILPCTLPAFSHIPYYFVQNAAIDDTVRWVKNNIPPSTAPGITRDSSSPTLLARDTYGNALGGIRLSQHAVPTAVNTGINFPTACRQVGSYQRFDEATLDALYRNHGAYVSQVSNVTLENLLRGFLVQEDAEATIQEAARAEIGKH